MLISLENVLYSECFVVFLYCVVCEVEKPSNRNVKSAYQERIPKILN
jgi:hypothetical protein